jgi:hypothetical protein
MNKNKELEKKIHYQEEQIEGLKIVINKYADERILFNEKKKSSNININRNYSNDEEISIGYNDKDLKEKINKLKEENKKLEQEIKSLKEKENNKYAGSDYKSEGGMDREGGDDEEEYTMKKMINEAKKKNQSDDIKIDYPGLNNLKQKYDELEERFRNLEEVVINLLNNIKCNDDIKPLIIDVCKALDIGDDMIKQIIEEK